MKALCIFSGGLDSLLAAELIRVQGISVQGLFFETPFFPSGRARKSASNIKLPLKVIDITKRHLEIVKSPRHGYGGNMNPCIDCHMLMLRKAAELLEAEGAGFVISGEVLGQRPMSQNRSSMNMVAAESGLGNLLLRPLSAKRLAPTVPEENGWVRRDLLMDIEGRSRKPQMALAEKLGIGDYPSPAGGCLLTEKAFSRRLRRLFSHSPHPDPSEIERLKLGRHFGLGPGTTLIVGRNKKENEALPPLIRTGDVVMKPVSVPGPTAILTGPVSSKLLDLATDITVAYSDSEPYGSVEMKVVREGKEECLSVVPRPKNLFKTMMI